jgi:hypothetical protein
MDHSRKAFSGQHSTQTTVVGAGDVGGSQVRSDNEEEFLAKCFQQEIAVAMDAVGLKPAA